MPTHGELRSLAAAFVGSDEPSFVSALGGTIIAWNAAMAELFGIPVRQALGQPCFATIGGRSPAGDVICRRSCRVVCEARAGRSAPPTDLIADAAGALVVLRSPCHEDGAGLDEQWCLVAPVVADDRLLAILTVGSRDAAFSISLAARVLFAVAAQLSVFMRWALPSGASRSLPAGAVDRAERPTLRAYCFGRFRVALDGAEIPPTRFKRQKSLTLLKLLVTQRGRPFRREALMELLWQSGARDAAIRQYETCRRMLRDELDVPPDEETQILYRTIVGGDRAAPQPGRRRV